MRAPMAHNRIGAFLKDVEIVVVAIMPEYAGHSQCLTATQNPVDRTCACTRPERPRSRAGDKHGEIGPPCTGVRPGDTMISF